MTIKCVCLSPYLCLAPNEVGMILSTFFSQPVDNRSVEIIAGSRQIREFIQISDSKFNDFSFFLDNCLRKFCTDLLKETKIVIVGPLNEKHRMNANHRLSEKFDEIYYLPLSDLEIFKKNDKLVIPGFPSFRVLPQSIQQELCSVKFFDFDPTSFLPRLDSYPSNFDPKIRIDWEGLYIPYNRPKRPLELEQSPIPLFKKSKTLRIEIPTNDSEKGYVPTPPRMSDNYSEKGYVPTPPRMSDEVREVRIRFNRIPEDCIISMTSEKNFIKTLKNTLIFPIGTRLAYEFPEVEKIITLKCVYFGSYANVVGNYDFIRKIFYIHP
jgi:hypothetical protein